jgi:histidinol-phosphate phosphatase family protein
VTDDRVLSYAVVVPTVGRLSLQRLLAGLASSWGPAPVDVVVVDDRPGEVDQLVLDDAIRCALGIRVIRGFGHGPAAARNLGWRVTSAPWVAFLDDDVELSSTWRHDLVDDLAACDGNVAGCQARLHVPLPIDRRPTDWERSTAGLERAFGATADMAYRREALLALHGFDERFPRAYREDADLALRARNAGWRVVLGDRTTQHPVREADDHVSLRVQRGNADDALMRALHGPRWRQRAQTGRGRLPWHAATVGALAAAGAGFVGAAAFPQRGVRRLSQGSPAGRFAAVAGLAWLAMTGDFAWRRIAPGPKDPAEVRRMIATSVAIPPAAVWHRLRGEWRHRSASLWPPPVAAVLFDRDGTLVHDVPYNSDPDRSEPMDGAVEALDRLRSKGIRVGVITNQSGVGRGLLSPEQVDAVNARIEQQLGPFDTWQVCLHVAADGCTCRKPEPGLVLAAARHLGVDPMSCVVVGDIGADVVAARAAGARSVLVPTRATRTQEIADSPVVAKDVRSAVNLLLDIAP